MTITELIEFLYKKNIYFHVKDNKLQIQAPQGSMTDELLALLNKNKSDLIKYIMSVQTDRKVIKPVEEKSGALSFAQQRFWLLDQIDGGGVHYNMPRALKLTGKLNIEALNKAFTSIIDRHESLRTIFIAGEDGQPLQIVKNDIVFVIPIIDLSTFSDNERRLKLSTLLAEEANALFDLSCDLMLRAQLVKITGHEHILMATMHHIASDGWSMAILINEFKTLYSAYVENQANPLAPLGIQYSDYAHWQRNWLQGEVLEQQLNYWAKQCANLPVVHNLPLDHVRPPIQSFTGDTYNLQIDASIIKSLADLCKMQGATLFMGLHAAFSVLLARYSNETDIVLGTPIANREQAEIAPLIGCFINTLLLRSDLSGSPSFIKLLQQSKNMLLEAYAHQQVPFEQIVERLQPERSLSHNPLFQIILVLQNNEEGVLELPDLILSPLPRERGGVAAFDLTLSMSENADGLWLGWEYNIELFERSTIIAMATHFELLLTALIHSPHESVFKVNMLGMPEREQLLMGWNDTVVDYPQHKCIQELFEQQVANSPDAVAIIFEQQQLTYAELDSKANKLAHYLINKQHIKPDTLVGICLNRSLEMVVGILAILKAGGAYVPLDPTLPEHLLASIVQDIGDGILLSESALAHKFHKFSCCKLLLDDEAYAHLLSHYPVYPPKVEHLHSDHLAYVLYTSGSTGKPKAIAMPHRALNNLLGGMLRESPWLGNRHKLVQFASIGFDMSFTDIFLTFNGGGCLVLIDNETRGDVVAFTQLLQQQQISALNLPYAMLQLMSEYSVQANINLPTLQCIISTAEQLKITPAIRAFFTAHPNCQLINHYGPSETHVVTALTLNKEVQLWPEFPSIGHPISNVSCYVLDNEMQPVPRGVAGNLYIGGDCLARGYLGQKELTEQRFVPNPFDAKANSRMYLTGDIVRRLKTGELEYLGRSDDQVKIHGFRIELTAIEMTLLRQQNIAEALVLVRDDESNEKRLVAYYRATDNNIDSMQLRHCLAQYLPDYMIPAAFIAVDQFPLTTNGKIDRRALPVADFTSRQAHYIAPRNELEKTICHLWQEILAVDNVGINDNFFLLGGHSLSAIRFVARINQHFKIELPLKIFFLCENLLSVSTVVAERIALEKNRSLKEETKEKAEVEW